MQFMTELLGNSIKPPCLAFQGIRETGKPKICLRSTWMVLKIFVETFASAVVILTTTAEILASPSAAIQPVGLASPVSIRESL